MMDEIVGKCAQCKGPLSPASGAEGRKWAMCVECGAQWPLEGGHLIVGSKPDKAAENSSTGMH